MLRFLFGFATAVSAVFIASSGHAADNSEPVIIEQASKYFYHSDSSDRFRLVVAPNYSEKFGFSMKAAAGGYLTDAVALGLIVEYGEDKREYLANAGVQFNDALSFVGTLGLLEEHNEYVDGEGKATVQQMEYGASLKGAYQVGILSGFELNGYLTNADADSDNVETGKLHGVQLLADLDLAQTTHFKLGGGYEWLNWDNGNDDDSSFTFSAKAVQQVGDRLSLTGNAKLGASEYVYGGGLAFDLSNGGVNTNTLGVNYSYINGRNGIEDDQRIELSWSIGFGARPARGVAAADLTGESDSIRPAADVAMVTPANDLLGEVTRRPAYLPERITARSAAGGAKLCSTSGVMVEGLLSGTANAFDFDSDGTNVGVLLHVISGLNDLPPTAEVAGVTLEKIESNYLFMGPSKAVIAEGDFYLLSIGQEQCLLQAHRHPL